jgi:hypothetical protein
MSKIVKVNARRDSGKTHSSEVNFEAELALLTFYDDFLDLNALFAPAARVVKGLLTLGCFDDVIGQEQASVIDSNKAEKARYQYEQITDTIYASQVSLK